jgi:putative NADH-flavin reductase
MHLLLLGATGRVGQSVIACALADGYQITAIVRDPAKVKLADARLNVVAGDVYKPETLEAPMRTGVDAVINVVGSDVFKPSTVVTDSARTLLAAMHACGVQRYLGTSGVAEMRPRGPGGALAQAFMRRSPIRHGVKDHDAAYALVAASDRDWTLAGCPYIKDGVHTGKYTRSTEGYPGGMKTISPQDVADFLVKEVSAHRYPRHIVGIWY